FLVLTCSLYFSTNYTTTAQLSTLSLHDALPISGFVAIEIGLQAAAAIEMFEPDDGGDIQIARRMLRRAFPQLFKLRSRSRVIQIDRKSTRLNSSHLGISYAVFCLKKKKRLKIT